MGLRRLAGEHRAALICGVVAVVGVAVALRVRHPFLVDDAGITARYAERIGDGKGWTYNDGDRTNGASAPLYTMILALAHVVGIDVLSAARAIGVLCFGASIGMVTYLGRRFAGWTAGLLSGAFLLTWVFYQDQALSGMESALAVVLGLAVVIALAHDRETVAGVLLGLALLNKLDAGLLAVAVAIAVIVVRRRVPWRLAWVSGIVLLPWVVFSVAYFHSPLPYSFTQKASGQSNNPTATFDRAWIYRYLFGTDVELYVLLAVACFAGVAVLRRRSTPAAVALTAVLLWPLVHATAFSLIDLGDRYSWYLTVLSPPIALGAGTALGLLVERAPGVSWRSIGLPIAVVAAITVQSLGILPIGSSGPPGIRDRLGDRPASPYEVFENLRARAGRYIGQEAEPGDIVLTCWGWIAYYAPQTTIAETCPLNTRKRPAGDPRWESRATFPGLTPPDVPPGAVLAASFISEDGEGSRVDVLRYGPA